MHCTMTLDQNVMVTCKTIHEQQAVETYRQGTQFPIDFDTKRWRKVVFLFTTCFKQAESKNEKTQFRKHVKFCYTKENSVKILSHTSTVLVL